MRVGVEEAVVVLESWVSFPSIWVSFGNITLIKTYLFN